MPFYRIFPKAYPGRSYCYAIASDSLTAAFYAGCHLGSDFPYDDQSAIGVALVFADDYESGNPTLSAGANDRATVYAVVPDTLDIIGQVTLFKTRDEALAWRDAQVIRSGMAYYVKSMPVNTL